MGDPASARALLGLGVDHDAAALRVAYRVRLRRVHPDLNASAGATEATIALREAFELLDALLTEAGEQADQSPSGEAEPASSDRTAVDEPAVDEWADAVVSARLAADDTIAIGASREEAGMALLDAAYRLGDVTYVDLVAGFLEVLVEFAGAPTSSLAMALQGRANGEVDVFCSIEPLSGGEVPPIDAVTRMLLHTLNGGDPTV